MLLDYLPDKHTRPALTTIQLIASNPLAQEVMSESLVKAEGLECKGGVLDDFMLSDLQELATDREPLLSFMYYTGALTHSKSANPSSSSLPTLLTIPNTTAKKEFIEEAIRIRSWRPFDLETARAAIFRLYANDEPLDLCNWIRKHTLSHLTGNDVKTHGESGLTQTFFDAFVYSYEIDGVKREYKVDKKKREGNLSGEAIDLVMDKGKKIVCIEFKNIKINQLRCGLKDESIPENWEDQCRISDQIGDEDVDEQKVLELPLRYINTMGSTVEDFLQKGVGQATRYRTVLTTGDPTSSFVIFVVLRVGLKRLIIRKLQ